MNVSIGYGKRSWLWRLAGLVCFLSFMWVFKFLPDLVDMRADGRVAWLTLFQVGGLALAAVLCHVASRRGMPSTMRAWRCFAVGFWLYFGGNAFYVYCELAGYEPGFPNLPEMAFFVMAGAFGLGMAKYGEMPMRVGRTTFYNFGLVYCAISVSCLFLLHDSVEISVLSHFGTLVALLYPALWFSVFAFGLMALSIYNHDRRSVPYVLMLFAVLAEACADIIYCRELVEGTYVRGGITETLWMASIGLAVWACFDRLSRPVSAALSVGRPTSPANKMALASLPGAAILVFMVSASVTGSFGDHPFYIVSSIVLGVVFAAVAALREHSIITKLSALKEDAADGRRKLSEVLESTSDSVIVVDHNWSLTYYNRQARKVLGGAGAIWKGKSLWQLPEGVGFPGRTKLLESVALGLPVEYEERLGPDEIWLGIHAFPTEEGMSIFFRDISDRRQARIEIENLALRDTLTGLANRASFHRSLDAKLANSNSVGILILDLDHFKEINDTRGHPVGDEVLRVVSDRLTACVTDGVVARLGGDEFAVILTGVDETSAAALADRMIRELARPIHLNDVLMRIGVSIGIALGNRKTDADILLRNADIALYEVKNKGRGGHAFFRKAMETLLIERNDMKQALAIALENDEFELHFQPLVDLYTGKVCSFEALLRWNHPVKGLQPPDAFIPLIEESGMIVPIGAWVMRTACRQAQSWPADISVAVNVSTRQFYDPGLINTIKSSLADTGLQPHRLELEITESALMESSLDNLGTLGQIRAMGIKIALDDYGTGYSSLNYLQKFRFDKLKIDKSFVQGLNVNKDSETIVRSVIDLGRSFGMIVTAEGVETQDQYDWLETRCQQAQGHFISMPIPTPQVAAFLASPPKLKREPERLQGNAP